MPDGIEIVRDKSAEQKKQKPGPKDRPVVVKKGKSPLEHVANAHARRFLKKKK
jgi:hypothetical protein